MAEAVLTLPATVTLAQASALQREIDAAIGGAGGGALRIDAAALQEFDTSAVALLLHAQRAAQSGGVALAVQGAPAKLRQLAQLYGVEPLLPPA